MKILHFYKTTFPNSHGGVEQVIHQVAYGCVSLKIDVDILSLSRVSKLSIDSSYGYNSHFSRENFQIASNSFSFTVLSKFNILASQADLIHYHFPWPFMDLIHFLAHHKKPTIVTYHSDIVSKGFLFEIYKPLMKIFLNDIDVIVATSKNYAKTSNVLTKYKNKVKVVPIGINPQDYVKPTPIIFKKWKNKIRSNFFLFVGVMRTYKAVEVILNALKYESYPFVFVGDGPLLNNLKTLAKALNLKNIYFVGEISDIDRNALYKLCYGVVSSSNLRSEAYGVSLVEGLMYGKPLVSTNIGTGTTFINKDKVTGIVIPPNNPKKLAEALRFLWSNPQIKKNYGINSKKRFKKYFTAKMMNKSYLHIYQSILMNKKTNKLKN